MSNIGAGGALSTSPDMVGNKAPVLTSKDRRTAPRRSANRSRSPRSRPTMGSRTSGTCRRRSAATTSCRRRRTACACRSSSIAAPAKPSTFDPPQTEGVGGHARRRRLALVGRLDRAADSGRQQVAGARDVRRARHLCHPRARARRRTVLLAGRDGRRHEMSSAEHETSSSFQQELAHLPDDDPLRRGINQEPDVVRVRAARRRGPASSRDGSD